MVKMIRFDDKSLCTANSHLKKTSKALKQPKELKAISIFPNESDLISMEFWTVQSEGSKVTREPVLAVLWQDYDANVNINLYTISENNCHRRKWSRQMIDKGTSLIVPSGEQDLQFMTLGADTVSYFRVDLDRAMERNDELCVRPNSQYSAFILV